MLSAECPECETHYLISHFCRILYGLSVHYSLIYYFFGSGRNNYKNGKFKQNIHIIESEKITKETCPKVINNLESHSSQTFDKSKLKF